MNRIHKILMLTLCSISIHASQAQNYAVFLAPADLLANSNAVLRNSVTEVEIVNEGKMYYTEKFAITILNAAGKEHADAVAHYDKLIDIRSFEGTLYDAFGKKVKSLKKKDIIDNSATGSSELADDNRVKRHNFEYQVYPYTIEYEISYAFKGLFYIPYWMPVEDEHFAVEQSALKVTVPSDYTLRYKTYNYTGEPEILHGKGTKTLQWEVKKYGAIKKEFASLPWHLITPSVFLAPSAFELQDYKGNMNDWGNLGKFLYSLNAGRDKLPENVRQKVHQLTDGITDTREKIRKLYQFMQNSTRYISVQLGIGGWQTFPAEYVASNGYGDCKALSNYMFSLLKEAGIKSYYTLIRAGENQASSFIADFPSNQFNHAILCVPQAKDTIWLECTSQTERPGYLGSFTSNRNCLLVDEQGGTVVRTPVYNKKDNLQTRRITSRLDNEGNLDFTVNTAYHAEQQDMMHFLMTGLSKEKISDYLKERLAIPSYDVKKFDYKQNDGSLPEIDEYLELTANNYATISGKRIFITPNILNKSTIKLPDQSKRLTPIQLINEYTDVDSVEIALPTGYEPETLPASTSLNTKFGTYKVGYSFQPGRLTYYRYLETSSGTFPPSDVQAYKEFYDAIYKSDRAKLVLVKKE